MMYVWEVIIVVAATLAAIVIPAKLVLRLPSADFSIFEILLSIVFAVDVVLYFGRVRTSRRSLKPYRYPLIWLGLDILAAIPFVLLSAPPVFQLFRLAKVARLLHYMQEFWRRNVHQSLVLRIVFFNFGLGMVTHWLSCGWLAVRGLNDTADALTNYISSMYFCITTLTTVGFGDVTPANNAERLYVICMMLFGVGVYGFAIANVASMLSKINPARAHYSENMERLDAFMRYKSLPVNLRKRLTDYYTYLWEQRLGYDESSILASLPPSLKTDVALHLKREIIQKVPLFNDASEGFIRDIALQIAPVVYLPGDYVFCAGEAGNDMYFVSKGELEVVSKDGQTIFTTLKDGDFFGEIALILKQPRTASVRATSFCDLYRLDRELFERVLSRYPEVAAKIQERAEERRTRE